MCKRFIIILNITFFSFSHFRQSLTWESYNLYLSDYMGYKKGKVFIRNICTSFLPKSFRKAISTFFRENYTTSDGVKGSNSITNMGRDIFLICWCDIFHFNTVFHYCKCFNWNILFYDFCNCCYNVLSKNWD